MLEHVSSCRNVILNLRYTINRIVLVIGRKPYSLGSNTFLEDNISIKNPFNLFHEWLMEAKRSSKVVEANTMCLSTTTRDGMPSARIMVCKNYGNEGFEFYTHYKSRKAVEMDNNPNVSLTFFWAHLHRAVRIEGCAQRLPTSYADDYLANRSYQNQIATLCSEQSKVVENRLKLMKRENELKQKYQEGQVPRPEFWGGYTVIPNLFEFWQGQTDQLHDRIRFKLQKEGEAPDKVVTHFGEDGWLYERLEP